MLLYSSKHEIIDADKYEFYSSGANSKVYVKNDEALKIYKDVKVRYYMKKKTFEMLKEADIPNLVKLRDYYNQYTGWLYEKIVPMDGYTMDFVEGTPVELLSADRKYIDIILAQLEETLNKLCEKKIIIRDSSMTNIIFNENGVTLIDPDYYYRSKKSPSSYIYQQNKEELIYSFNSIFTKEFKNKYGQKGIRRLLMSSVHGSLTSDFNHFYKEDNIEETVKKYVYTF